VTGYLDEFHIGRSWFGTSRENDCPCGKAPCGLVDATAIHPDCDQHHIENARTMRQIHAAKDCPVGAGDGLTGVEGEPAVRARLMSGQPTPPREDTFDCERCGDGDALCEGEACVFCEAGL
jgi:hypothetical protein